MCWFVFLLFYVAFTCGYILDINECITKEDEEAKCRKDHELCINTQGSFYCSCEDGYRKNSNGECEINVEGWFVLHLNVFLCLWKLLWFSSSGRFVNSTRYSFAHLFDNFADFDFNFCIIQFLSISDRSCIHIFSLINSMRDRTISSRISSGSQTKLIEIHCLFCTLIVTVILSLSHHLHTLDLLLKRTFSDDNKENSLEDDDESAEENETDTLAEGADFSEELTQELLSPPLTSTNELWFESFCGNWSVASEY